MECKIIWFQSIVCVYLSFNISPSNLVSGQFFEWHSTVTHNFHRQSQTFLFCLAKKFSLSLSLAELGSSEWRSLNGVAIAAEHSSGSYEMRDLRKRNRCYRNGMRDLLTKTNQNLKFLLARTNMPKPALRSPVAVVASRRLRSLASSQTSLCWLRTDQVERTVRNFRCPLTHKQTLKASLAIAKFSLHCNRWSLLYLLSSRILSPLLNVVPNKQISGSQKSLSLFLFNGNWCQLNSCAFNLECNPTTIITSPSTITTTINITSTRQQANPWKPFTFCASVQCKPL